MNNFAIIPATVRFDKRLKPNETFVSVPCSITQGKDLNEVIKNLTLKRRELLKIKNKGLKYSVWE